MTELCIEQKEPIRLWEIIRIPNHHFALTSFRHNNIESSYALQRCKGPAPKRSIHTPTGHHNVTYYFNIWRLSPVPVHNYNHYYYSITRSATTTALHNNKTTSKKFRIAINFGKQRNRKRKSIRKFCASACKIFESNIRNWFQLHCTDLLQVLFSVQSQGYLLLLLQPIYCNSLFQQDSNRRKRRIWKSSQGIWGKFCEIFIQTTNSGRI